MRIYTGERRSVKNGGVPETRGQIRHQVSMDQRPHSVETKRFYGNGEGYLILGKNHPVALLTLGERKSKYTLIYPLESKESKGVVPAFVEVMQPFKGNIHRIPLDNGKAFRGHESMSEQRDTQIYFAHPYPSWEPG